MDLELDNIRVGGVYVNSFRGIAKRVLAADRWGIEYRSYALANGAELMTSRCSIYYFRRWAEREATQDEYATLRSTQEKAVCTTATVQAPTCSALRQALRLSRHS